LFARSIAAVLPGDLPPPIALAVLDVCGAPALTRRVVKEGAVVVVVGAAGKSGSLSAAAARQSGAAKIIGVVPTEKEAALLRNPMTAEDGGAGRAAPASEIQQSRPRPATHARAPESPLVDEIVIADARDPVGLAERVTAAGGLGDVTVVCVDVPGCEGGAILSTRQGGTVIFFSMATSFAAAALGAEGLAADVTMLIGNGYVPGHAEFALDLVRTTPSVRRLFERRVTS
jgi:L-erythro-3,5-diaminohexanoate dehydrogenase